jgi:hypothetical protein
VDQTPFYRLKLTRQEAEKLQRHSPATGVYEAIRRLVRFSYIHGCLPFGRLDATLVRAHGPVVPSLARACTSAAATQRGFDFATLCYIFPPVLDPWLQHQSAALLSGDGRFGLLIQQFRRERTEEFAYTCTSALADGTTICTRWGPPNLCDPPCHRVAHAPSRVLKDTLAFHASRITDLPVVPYAAAKVPEVIRALNQEVNDYNVACGRFLPLSLRELDMIRAAMRGQLVRDRA